MDRVRVLFDMPRPLRRGLREQTMDQTMEAGLSSTDCAGISSLELWSQLESSRDFAPVSNRAYKDDGVMAS